MFEIVAERKEKEREILGRGIWTIERGFSERVASANPDNKPFEIYLPSTKAKKRRQTHLN